MTVATTTSRIAYTGNGATTSFSFPYPFFLNTDLQVYVAGVLKTLTTDYTVSGVAPYPSGANVVFGAAPANGASIVLVRVLPYTQTLDLVANDPLPADPLEQRLDAGVLLAQQLLEVFARVPQLAITSLQSNISLADLVANKALVVNGAGNGIIMGPTTTDIANAAANAAAAAASATAAAGSATSASGSATTATTQASNASTSATNAATSATNASTSATNAANSATAAAARTLTGFSASKTFAVGDQDQQWQYTGTGGHTATVPTNAAQAFAVGAEIEIVNSSSNSSSLILTASAGVTVNGVASPASGITIPFGFGGFLKKTATNTWLYVGVFANEWV